jgi:hypothetical protein
MDAELFENQDVVSVLLITFEPKKSKARPAFRPLMATPSGRSPGTSTAQATLQLLRFFSFFPLSLLPTEPYLCPSLLILGSLHV